MNQKIYLERFRGMTMVSHEKLLTNNRFLVFFGNDSSKSFSFSKISNIQNAIEYDTIVEGGNNLYAHAVQKPKGQTETIVLEKGVRLRDSRDKKGELVPGTKLANGLEIIVLQKVVQNDQTKVCKDKVARAYGFNSGIITKWELSPFDALGNEILVNKVEIVHTGLYEIGTGKYDTYTIK